MEPALLRMPPFSFLTTKVVFSEKLGGVAVKAEALTPRQEALAHTLRKARVGGMFWAPPVVPGRSVVMSAPVQDGQMWLKKVLAFHQPSEVALVTPEHETELASVARRLGVEIITAPCDPHTILDTAQCIYGPPGDDLVLLAALGGQQALCYGPTGELFRVSAVYAMQQITTLTRYTSPFTGEEINCASAIELLSFWRGIILENRNIRAAFGMSWWKRRRMRQFLDDASGGPRFTMSIRTALGLSRPQHSPVAVWASRLPAALESGASKDNIPLWRVEDGFIRSQGLGAGFTPPASVVVDKNGIYSDPRSPSALDIILEETIFDERLLSRARALMQELTRRGISKYGQSESAPSSDTPPPRPGWLPSDGRPVFLVPGQVEDDLSVRHSGSFIHTNRELLAKVRSFYPEAFIVYRPHPDVEAGYRRGYLGPKAALSHADHIDRNTPIAELLGWVHEVHTLSSLCGFEALLRGLKVVTYGLPFYAGWGLTEDIHPAPGHRGRRLLPEELVAGALILYPRYVDPLSGLPCTVELLVERFGQGASWPVTWPMRLRRMQGQLCASFRRMLRFCGGS